MSAFYIIKIIDKCIILSLQQNHSLEWVRDIVKRIYRQ
jgi:hypothetical protein